MERVKKTEEQEVKAIVKKEEKNTRKHKLNRPRIQIIC